MKTSEILKAAKARLTPETWGKGWRNGFLPSDRECAMFAVQEVCGVVTADERLRAMDLLGEVATGHASGYNIPAWNDAPERTYQDVMEAFSAAIAIAEQEEAAQDQPASPALVTA